jgi:hypothetical protein
VKRHFRCKAYSKEKLDKKYPELKEIENEIFKSNFGRIIGAYGN